MTCEQVRANRWMNGLVAFFGILFWPVFLLAMMQRGDFQLTLPIVLSASVIYPLSIVAHELGHACSGRLLGLEVGMISIGSGPILWRFVVRGVPVEIRTWPVSGVVYFGSATARWLRTRLWLGILAGALANGGLIVLIATTWDRLEPVFGREFLAMSVIVNFFLILLALLPYRGGEGAQACRSDGLMLLELPRDSHEKLELFRISALLMRGFSFFNARDYAQSKAIAEQLLARSPDCHFARIMISANECNLGNHAEALRILVPTLAVIESLDAYTRAVVRNNVAFALTMSHAASPLRKEEGFADAERFSTESFTAFPCVLAFRNTRALLLAVTGREAEALELLRYAHYETAPTMERGMREGTRAVALNRLGRVEESKLAAKTSIGISPEMERILSALGAPA